MKTHTVTINFYSDDTDAINILDTGFVVMDGNTIESIVDLALEISLRKKIGVDHQVFLDRLEEVCAEHIDDSY